MDVGAVCGQAFSEVVEISGPQLAGCQALDFLRLARPGPDRCVPASTQPALKPHATRRSSAASLDTDIRSRGAIIPASDNAIERQLLLLADAEL